MTRSLVEKLSDVVGAAFSARDLPADLGAVRVSDRPDLAQFQCNGAMAAAKIAGKAPRDIANDIVGTLAGHGDLSRVDIAGPGFINLDVTDDYLAAHLRDMAGDSHLGVPQSGSGQTVVLDYGGPNIAKPMHVGHLRSAIIGDSLRLMMRYAGFKTLGDVHMGDWGTHMGMIVSEFIRTGATDRILGIDLEDEEQIDALMGELGVMYPQIAAACKEDPARKEEALAATVKIQNKESPYFDLLQLIRKASVNGMRRNYALLGVHFDLWKGEADVHDLIAPMVADLKAKKLAVESDGATVIPVKRDDDKKEMPPLILYKRDGGVMYGTTDLATIVERVSLYDPARIIYVVDQRQHLHFEQLFRAAMAGAVTRPDVALFFAGFGTMNGTDGKPFKTRAGGVMKLEDLIAMALDKARERLDEAALAQDMDEAEKNDVAHKVAIAAIKFADLQNQRTSDYVFDLDRFAAFEGKTGPYMLYQAVRIKSLLRKAYVTNDIDIDIDTMFRDLWNNDVSLREGDRSLALQLAQFSDAFDAALRHYMPHHLAEYAYQLANSFSSFYANCHILSEDDPAIRQSRLALCVLTYKVLETTLAMLGIAIPRRM